VLDGDSVWMRLDGHGKTARFSYSTDGENFTDLGYEIDATILSDDHIFGFTGAYVGIAAFDLYDHTGYADFTYFRYEAL
jgi:xylan 1,4-beta-xylosidase